MHGYGRQIPQWCVGFHYKPRRPHAGHAGQPASVAAECMDGRARACAAAMQQAAQRAQQPPRARGARAAHAAAEYQHRVVGARHLRRLRPHCAGVQQWLRTEAIPGMAILVRRRQVRHGRMLRPPDPPDSHSDGPERHEGPRLRVVSSSTCVLYPSQLPHAAPHRAHRLTHSAAVVAHARAQDCWHPTRDANGTLVPFAPYFPNGMKAVCRRTMLSAPTQDTPHTTRSRPDHIPHTRHLAQTVPPLRQFPPATGGRFCSLARPEVWLVRRITIPQPVGREVQRANISARVVCRYTSVGTKTCHHGWSPGSFGHYKQDAELFASWGIDVR
jgi:hypothetical protein